ncbi:MAG: VRR-NUC domain-containing protein [Oscillospiraceae bacterium]|nr:VRR-NUC domain-containing protein [Oscillospiraceae bacterium]
MREKTVEQYLCRRVKEVGGKAYKLVSPGNDGMPDRLVCLPGGKVIFVETKAPGKTPDPRQLYRHLELLRLGLLPWTVDSKERVDQFILCEAEEVMPNDIPAV